MASILTIKIVSVFVGDSNPGPPDPGAGSLPTRLQALQKFGLRYTVYLKAPSKPQRTSSQEYDLVVS